MRASLLCAAVLLLAAVSVSAKTPSASHVHITLLHLNDCYELIPTSSSDLGGVARVATLRKQLLAANPNTYTMLAGDLFSPSALSNTPVLGRQGGFQGEQMVVAMNMIGVDYACLGNHEADVNAEAFTANMQRSNFQWLSANAMNQSYAHLNKSAVFKTATQEKQATVGVLGLTIDSNNRTGVQTWYGFDYASRVIAPAEIESLNAQGVDIIVALTHYDFAVDQELVKRNAGISIVVGGHDHIVVQIEGTEGKASIYKAESNVRSVWVHELYIDPSLPKTDPDHFLHFPRLVQINSSLTDDQPTRDAIAPYLRDAYASFATQGFNATRIIATLTVDIDMRTPQLALGPTPATTRMAECVYASAITQLRMLGRTESVDLAMVNIGILRLDDILKRGTTLSEYDVLRFTPFANPVWVAKISGSYLKGVFELSEVQGRSTAVSVFRLYLAYTNVTKVARNDGTFDWFISGVPLNEAPGATYNVATTSHLLHAPKPYVTMSPALSPQDITLLLNQTNVANGLGDARRFFIDSLTRDFPPRVAPTPGAPQLGEPVYVQAELAVAFSSLSANFSNLLAQDINQALDIRLDRVQVVQLSQSLTNGAATTLFLRLAPNLYPDPITAAEAAADFVAQANGDANTYLRKGVYSGKIVPGSAKISPSATPPPTRKLDDGAAAGVTASIATAAAACTVALAAMLLA